VGVESLGLVREIFEVWHVVVEDWFGLVGFEMSLWYLLMKCEKMVVLEVVRR
tara:strand:+ start:683 stop:838 length:156 start_codon:yes stop_codon:yes gene_type:complete